MLIPASVFRAWPVLRQATFPPEPTSGGFSGAGVWRIKLTDATVCLKAWDSSGMSAVRLKEIHPWMEALSQQLSFIPKLYRNDLGKSFLEEGVSLWEVHSWLPGKSLDYRNISFEGGLEALAALSKMHQASMRYLQFQQQSPAVTLRMDLIRKHLQGLDRIRTIGSRNKHPGWEGEIESLSHQTLDHFKRRAGPLLQQLNGWTNRCDTCWVLRDLHADHVLFEGHSVTGIIDFGAARIDEPVTDLVRLLGSLWPYDRAVRERLIAVYNELSSISIPPARYHCLDHVSTLLSAMQWWQWLVVEQRSFTGGMAAALARWKLHVERLLTDQW